MENRRKGKWKVTYLHEEEIEGKWKKNEENRGLDDKKDYEDQFTTFCQYYLGALFYSLSLSITLAHLEKYWIILGACLENSSFIGLEKEGKGKWESSREQVDQQLHLGFFTGNRLHVWFPWCMVDACFFLVMICHLHGGLLGLIVVLA